MKVIPERRIPENKNDVKEILCEQLALLAEDSKDTLCSWDKRCEISRTMKVIVDALIQVNF